uniref:Serine/threonine protein phosphatase n=1 Tax=Desulfovibrio sp. U5L TaxID=596152 RepID=I2PWZ2_9BACT
MSICFKAASHVGLRRKKNEDRYLAKVQADGSLLLAVADGMGGSAGGEKAATEAIATYSHRSDKEIITPQILNTTLLAAHDAIVEYGKLHKILKGMGTTLTAALVRDAMVYWAHIGDSRLYMLKSGKLAQLTTDHRFLESLTKDGFITLEQANRHPFKNVLDQCLGCPEIDPEIGNAKIKRGDVLMLCTDGLHDDISSTDIERILKMELSLENKVGKLMSAALEAGGKDNITIVLAEN